MSHTKSVKDFYEHNTRRFLRWGGGTREAVIHREVWGPGVGTKAAAFHYVHQLLLEQVNRQEANPVHLLDLGCGVGSSLFYLCRHAQQPCKATGISVSPTQIATAETLARENGLAAQCAFIEADFLNLPSVPPVNLAYSIEAFVHAADAAGYFREAAATLSQGGRLVLIDDMLETDVSESDAMRRDVARFREGWRLGSLHTVEAIEQFARGAHLSLVENNNLTSYLNLGRPRDYFIKALFILPGITALNPTYLRSLDGGDALQTCLKKGWVSYRMLVFEKA
ncbi:MAG: methyltransferase domain-containing protein [Bacteroidota bacterium]